MRPGTGPGVAEQALRQVIQSITGAGVKTGG